jgi:membrane protease YdiL (CAAX protease family)
MKKIIVYLSITFSITWAIWGILACFTNKINNPIVMLIIAITMFVPMIGAFLTKALLEKEDIKLELKPKIKHNIKYYLFAWFVPSIITLLGAVIYFCIFRNFDASAPYLRGLITEVINAGGANAEEITKTINKLSLSSIINIIILAQIISALTFGPLINMIFAFGEELGWRGFLFPALCEKFSERKAIIISGVIWGLWHAPITMMGHNYGLEYWGYPITGILTMIVFCTSLGAVLSYLTVKTQSVWPAALAHGSVNAVAAFGILFVAKGSTVSALFGPSIAGLVGGIPCLILGIICYLKCHEKSVSQV